MRLTCPNCGAQYRVPAEVIPQTGRDVQCSNCGDTWFQTPAHQADALEAEPSAPGASATPPPADADPAFEAEEPQPAPARPEQREIDPAVTSVLREEAERERRARAAAQEGLTTQPDLGLDTAPDPAPRAEEARAARRRGAEAKGTPEATDVDPAPRRGLFPDIEEINSSLAPGSGQDAKRPAPTPYPEASPKRGGGFRRGFLLAVLVMLLALLVYIFAPQLAEAIPAVGDLLADYVGWVDGLRGWLDGVASAAADASGN